MTTLHQLELDQTDVNCGMSYVFQLEDGSFFIIDGGYFTPGEEDRLFDFLVRTGGETPRISAWFFTHAHQDHVGNFIQFMWKYRKAVDIQKLLFSFHPVDLSEVEGDWKSSDPATIKEFYQTVDAYCSDVERVTLQVGDQMTFGDMVIEVIYTYEQLYPTRSSFNDYSTVITTTVGDQKILWLADAGRMASEILLERLESLACDIVQISHHGIDNFPILREVYAATGANVALWPTPDYGMMERQDQEVNRFVLRDLDIREHLVSGYGTSSLELPYELGTAAKHAKSLSFSRQPDPSQGIADEDPSFRYMTPERVGG